MAASDNTVTLLVGGSLELILRQPEPEPAKGYVSVTVIYDKQFKATSKGAQAMSYTLPNDKLVVVKVAYVDSKGNPAAIDGDVEWDTSNAAAATVTVDSGDSATATITGVDVGTAQISATADADLGQGVKEITTLLEVEVVAGEAVAGTINVVGDQQPQAPHPEQQTRRR